MVRKTEAVGMDTIELGAALAVIRYNDGFAGLKNVFEMLGVNVGYICLQDWFSWIISEFYVVRDM